jgi:spermidine/putrescine transport system permease protein
VLALGTLLLIGSFLLLSVAEFLRRRAERQTRMTGTAHA